MQRLKDVGRNEIGLLSNARCLSEGVDVPSLDGVAFIDPRSSEIDIIQSVGRAIRLSENKTLGTIVLPVFIEQADDAEEALEASEFKPIWDVLEALKLHDDRLSDELDQLRIELGAKKKRSVTRRASATSATVNGVSAVISCRRIEVDNARRSSGLPRRRRVRCMPIKKCSNSADTATTYSAASPGADTRGTACPADACRWSARTLTACLL
jgi:predicted helicase